MNTPPTKADGRAAMLDRLLDRNPNHKDGTPGSFRLRLMLVQGRNLVCRKVRLGLRTTNIHEARTRAWVAIAALRNAGVQLGNIIFDARGERLDLNTLQPPPLTSNGEEENLLKNPQESA